ncbi:MAG: tetratricopeptide repeat protein [Leptolyngbya sp. UWPOB_LEPTO1]|uniref:tetratricopeptide repeat protein n=1 Tax=Leptolyngbya sp. UWPOB_LEPTO1 TaxID=2815653 RepID=UPI001AD58667|nr:tetratricopeptide repeat protein [Leptolyngbya sp. UWPOB_LEPTO1]MBN8559568.1 tetratricopeptide repeat protein [Leptolyngbya sp. UWPOB_LEPTO1]
MTDEQFKINAQDNARVNAIGKINAERVDFGDRINFQQRVSVVGLDPIPPEHKAHEWIDRTEPQRELLARLQTQKLIELVAVGGFGKSLLANWLFHQVRGEFERSLWLNFRKVPTFNEFVRWVLQEIGFLIDDPRVTDEDLSVELVYRLTEKRCLLVLDQLEAVQNGNDRASFEQFLQTWYQRGRSSIVIVTTRSTFGINSEESFALVGLTDAEGSKFLAKQGISAIADQGLERLTQLANGHPLLLGLAASWVRQEAEGSLRERDLDFFERLFCHYQGDSEAKVEEIFTVLFAELPERLRSLLLGVVVYRDAFGLEMAQAMLEDATIEDLQTLSDRAFLRQESERWTLHPLMQGLVERELKKSEQQRESHERAIAYFAANIQPWTGLLSDCVEELEIFHHRCELGEYALADQMMDTCVDSLDRRGYYRDLLPIYQQLTHAWTDANPEDAEEQRNLGWAWIRLGNLYRSLGQYQATIVAYTKAQLQFDKLDFAQGKAASLMGLGNAYDSLGQYDRAINFHQQSLEIQREIGNRGGEANSLMGLGNAYYSLGQYDRAINFYQQSLEIQREIGNRGGEAASLGNLGSAYQSLGQYDRAINFHQQSLEIKREIGDRGGEANSLMGLGNAYHSLGQYDRAINFYQQSLEIQREIGDRRGEANSYFNLGLALAKLRRKKESLEAYQNARRLYQEMGLDQDVEDCDKALRPPRRKINWILWFCVGIAIVLLIAWLRK